VSAFFLFFELTSGEGDFLFLPSFYDGLLLPTSLTARAPALPLLQPPFDFFFINRRCLDDRAPSLFSDSRPV